MLELCETGGVVWQLLRSANLQIHYRFKGRRRVAGSAVALPQVSGPIFCCFSYEPVVQLCHPGGLGFIGDETLPSSIGIYIYTYIFSMSHYKNLFINQDFMLHVTSWCWKRKPCWVIPKLWRLSIEQILKHCLYSPLRWLQHLLTELQDFVDLKWWDFVENHVVFCNSQLFWADFWNPQGSKGWPLQNAHFNKKFPIVFTFPGGAFLH